MKYGIEDVEIVDDAVGVVRARAEMYAGPEPRGARLAAAVAEQLVEDGELPVRVDQVGPWRVVTCGTDWLAAPALSGVDCWRRIVPTGQVHGMRPEVLLTALSDGLFTASGGRLDWIVPNEARLRPFRRRLDAAIQAAGSGRVVGFVMDAEGAADVSAAQPELEDTTNG